MWLFNYIELHGFFPNESDNEIVSTFVTNITGENMTAYDWLNNQKTNLKEIDLVKELNYSL